MRRCRTGKGLGKTEGSGSGEKRGELGVERDVRARPLDRPLCSLPRSLSGEVASDRGHVRRVQTMRVWVCGAVASAKALRRTCARQQTQKR